MAYMATAAIQTRLRQVLDAAAGTLRTIASNRFQADSYPGIRTEVDAIRSLIAPTVRAEIVRVRPSPDSPMTMHSLALREIDVRVTVTRTAELTAKISAATRDALLALAAQDADVIVQALSYPGNLTATTAGTATGICTGLLMHDESSVAYDDLGLEASAIVRSEHNFRGIVQVTQATS